MALGHRMVKLYWVVTSVIRASNLTGAVNKQRKRGTDNVRSFPRKGRRVVVLLTRCAQAGRFVASPGNRAGAMTLQERKKERKKNTDA